MEHFVDAAAVLEPGKKRTELRLEDYLSPNAAEAIDKAEQIAQTTGRKFVGTEHLFQAVLIINDPEVEDILNYLGAPSWLIRGDLERFVPKVDGLEPIKEHIAVAGAMTAVMVLAARNALDDGRSKIKAADLLIGLAEETQGISPAILKKRKISAFDLRAAAEATVY